MPNKVYTVVEELITFSDSGGSAVITLQNLATVTGRLSARYDRGTGAKPSRARIWGKFQLETAGAVGEQIEVYVVNWSSHATPLGEGALGTADAALTADQRLNLGVPALIVIVDKTTTAADIIGSAIIEVAGRYVSVGVWNATTDNLENTANASQVSIEWLPDEIQ